jgi:hypothetical protein
MFFRNCILASSLLLCICVPSKSAQAQHPSKTVVVNINYSVDGELVVQPKLSGSYIGDTVEFRTQSGGEMILRFVNPFSNDGSVVRSSNGVLRLSSQNGGRYKFRCSIQYPDGRIVGWEAGDRDDYNGGVHDVKP